MALCELARQPLVIGMILGVLGAIAGAFAGYEIRHRLVELKSNLLPYRPELNEC